MVTTQVTTRKIGASIIRFTDLDETPQDIKTTETNLYGYNIINPNTTAVYVKFYNLASGDVTVGTSAVFKTLYVPASGTVVIEPHTLPLLNADVALSVAVTTGLADSDTTAPTLDLTADFSYG